jgi:hypothetical protein
MEGATCSVTAIPAHGDVGGLTGNFAVWCLLHFSYIDWRCHEWLTDDTTMRMKHTLHQNLTDQQRLERLAQLCQELQAAVDQAGDHRRLLEQLKQTAQELLTDQELQPRPKRPRRRSPSASQPFDKPNR